MYNKSPQISVKNYRFRKKISTRVLKFSKYMLQLSQTMRRRISQWHTKFLTIASLAALALLSVLLKLSARVISITSIPTPASNAAAVPRYAPPELSIPRHKFRLRHKITVRVSAKEVAHRFFCVDSGACLLKSDVYASVSAFTAYH